MIQVFKQVVHGAATRERIAQAQKKSVNWITEVLNHLEKENFIMKKKAYRLKGSRITIEIAGTNHATKLKELMFQYPSIKFEEILSNSKLSFLTVASEDWITLEEASKVSKVSKNMILRYTRRLQNRGVLIRKNKKYRVNEKAWPLRKEFLIAYRNHAVVNGAVKWKYQDEIVFEVDDEKLVQGSRTGLSRYADYGIKVFVVKILCRLPKESLSKEEIFIHSLFQIEDVRTLNLAIVFYIKCKLNYKKVVQLAMKYGKYTMFEDMWMMIDTKEESLQRSSLPAFDRKDFKRIARLYGLKNV
jgi:predicted transcriptional regulator